MKPHFRIMEECKCKAPSKGSACGICSLAPLRFAYSLVVQPRLERPLLPAQVSVYV